MKEQQNVKDDNINLEADDLTDLPVTDEQADQTKAGSPYLFLHCANGKHIG